MTLASKPSTVTSGDAGALSREHAKALAILRGGDASAAVLPSPPSTNDGNPSLAVAAMWGKGKRVFLASPGGRRGRGGMASLVTYLADALPDRLPGVRVAVLDTYGPGPFWAMPVSFAVALLRLIVARLRGDADLLHIHMATYGSAVRKPLLALVATALKVPTLMHLHGSDFDDFFRALSPWQRKLLVGVLRRCDRVIVIGNHWQDFVVKEVGLDPRRVVLIHNGAPASVWATDKMSDQAPRLLMLGELGTRKGTPELVAALATRELRRTEWTATLAGNGPVDQFRKTIGSLGLSDRIHLPGWQNVDQVRALLGAADILLLPSRQEGLPMAILEAMASGVAVISTPVGAIPDAIIDGETGLLVPPGNVGALSDAILKLLHNPALRQRLAVNARARFERMFTIDRTADAIATVYRELGVCPTKDRLLFKNSR
jgi:glycosyltransferase involved in cell wall biosynthesis